MRKLTIIAAALTTLSLIGVSAPAQAKVPGPIGQIAFSRFDPAFGDDASYIMNPDGSNVRPLFPSFASNSPHWSPDGTQVAVVSFLGNACPPTCTGNTVIINPGTGAYRVLASPDFPAVQTFCSVWSPDATHFACDGENDSDPSVNGIYTIRSSDGVGLTRITNAGAPLTSRSTIRPTASRSSSAASIRRTITAPRRRRCSSSTSTAPACTRSPGRLLRR